MKFKDLMAPYVKPLHPVPTSAQTMNNLRSPIRAILFDIYGTLFISGSGDISNTEKKQEQTSSQQISGIDSLLKKYGIVLNYSKLKERLSVAIKTDHAVSKEKGIDFPEIQIEQILMRVLSINDLEVARQVAVEYEMIVNPVYPMPHLQNTLKNLRTNDIQMGIISNAQFFTPYLFDLFCDDFPENLGFNPNLIFYSYEYGYAKPSLFLFEQASVELNHLGIRPDNILYVGNDMLNDIYAAHTVGFQTCLFAGDSRSLRLREDQSECALLKPDAIIKALNQLTDMIRSF
jgi:putative hydrolase of the HAD superfamily